MSKPAAAGLVFFLVVLAILIFSSVRLMQHNTRVEVCIVFNGRESCRTASGETRDLAMRAAVENACALISSGVSETIACHNTEPKRVRWLK